MSDKILVGLDFGTTKICAVVARQNAHGKIDILGIGKSESRGAIERGSVVNIDKTTKAIRNAVDAARIQSAVDIQTVYVGIAGEHIRSFNNHGIITFPDSPHEITKDDLKRLYEDMFRIALQPGEQIIHVLPQEYEVDNHRNVMDPVGMSGVRLAGNFHIVAGKTSAVQNILRCVQRAGLHTENIFLEPIASSAAVLSEEEREAGTLLIDIGGGTTDVVFYKDNVIRHTHIIPFGGNIITSDIREGCSIMQNQAEVLKVRFGSALPMTVKHNEIVTIPGLQGRPPKEISRYMLAEIISARLQEVITFILRDLYENGFKKNDIVGGMVLTGGGSMLRDIKSLFEYTTGLDCRLGNPSQHLAGGLAEEASSPIYSTAIGLILEGFKLEESLEMEESNEQTPEETTQISHQKELNRIEKKRTKAWLSEIFSRTKEVISDSFKNTNIE